MINYILRLVNITPGKEKNTALFALLAFLWAFAVTSAQKFGDSLFMHHIGAEGLPFTYQVSALGLIVLAGGLMYVFDRVRIHTIFITLLCSATFFYAASALYLYLTQATDSVGIWYAIRIFGTLIFAVSITGYWSFVDHYHDRSDARKLYSLYSSSIFIGIISTGSLMRSGLVTFETLAVLIGILLFTAIVIIRYLVSTVAHAHKEEDRIGSEAMQSVTWQEHIRLVITSPLTLLMISANFLTYVLLVITEYSYLSTFQSVFGTGIDALGDYDFGNSTLTKFLGQWIVCANIINLIIGLFLYSRILARYGLGSLVVCTPIFLLITFFGWSSSQSLAFPVMGLFVVEGMLLVIDDSNFNILLNEVPVKIKYKLRLAIESCFEPAGMIVSSLLLEIPAVNSKVLGLALSSVFLCVALFLRHRYNSRPRKTKVESFPLLASALDAQLAPLSGEFELAISGLTKTH